MTPFLSHIIPTFKLAKHFQRRGYNVIYVSTPKLEHDIVANGFIFQNSAILNEHQALMKVDELIPHIMSLHKPEICLVELSFWNWALFLMGMRQHFMMIQTWPCCNKAPFLQPNGYRITRRRGLLSYVKNELSWIRQNNKSERLIRSAAFRNYYDDTVRKANLAPGIQYISMKNRISHYRISNVTELILFPEELDFPRKHHLNSKFIGPFIDTNRKEPDWNWNNVPHHNRPIVFCSLGSLSSIFKHRNSFYARMIEAFSKRPDIFLIMSVGKDSALLGSVLPDNIHLCQYAPQLQILAKASAFITHGGAGSIRESAHFGVPMIVYPWQARSDMFGTADRIVYHNLGLVGDMQNDSAEDIMGRIDRLLSDTNIRKNAQRMKQVFSEYESKENEFVDFILSKPAASI
jgi:UDP:flavonoid glycosyltransferase YjiC (YdhE family)